MAGEYQKENRIRIIADLGCRKDAAGHSRRWVSVSCHCGKVFEVLKRSVTSGNTLSCGCLATEEKRSRAKPESTFWRRKYNSYRQVAKDRDLGFALTFEEFVELAKSDCFYCGQAPIENWNASNAYRRWASWAKREANEEHARKLVTPANGIDRPDNTRGYSVENAVACCFLCNRAKSDLTFEQWMNWVRAIASHQFLA
jgi:hypothetical protein